MRQTSVSHVLRTNMGINFKITLFFDTPYAKYLDDFPQHKGWFENISAKFETILLDTLETTLRQSGMEIRIT